MLWFMIVCAVFTILLVAREAFSDLYDTWKHPEHKGLEDLPHEPSSQKIENPGVLRQHSPAETPARNRVIAMPGRRGVSDRTEAHPKTRVV